LREPNVLSSLETMEWIAGIAGPVTEMTITAASAVGDG
jgi:hypothetical protein